MEIRALAASVLELEAHSLVESTPNGLALNREAIEQWNEMVHRIITLLEPPASTRNAWRVPVTSKVMLHCGHRTLTVAATDLSHTGLGVRCRIPWLAPGDEGEILLAQSKLVRFALHVKFRVVWQRDADPESGNECYYGLQFEKPDLADWHRGFRSWYLHAFDSLLHDLAAGESRWEPETPRN